MLALYEPNAIPDEGSFALACVGVGVGGFAGARGVREMRQSACLTTSRNR